MNDKVRTTEEISGNSELATIYFTSSIKHCWRGADTRLAYWSLVSQLLCVCTCTIVCVCVCADYI